MRCCARVFIERLSQEPVVNTCRTGNPVRDYPFPFRIRKNGPRYRRPRPAAEQQHDLCGDSLYVYSTEWSWITNKNTITYAIVDTKTKRVVSRNFIRDGTDKTIQIPYGVAVNLDTREIFVTDAKDYVTPGTLYCFDPDGKKKWSVTTGDIPAHIAFTYQKLRPLE